MTMSFLNEIKSQLWKYNQRTISVHYTMKKLHRKDDCVHLGHCSNLSLKIGLKKTITRLYISNVELN